MPTVEPRLESMPPQALIVDADPASRKMCREILERSGFSVRDTDSGVTAVSAAREMAPDLILLDLQLRDVSGREAFAWLRSNPALQSTPIVTLSTRVEGERLPEAGIWPTLSLHKPVSAQALTFLITMVSKIRDTKEQGTRK